MKLLAIIANLILLGLVIFLAIEELEGADGEELLFILIFFVTPIISIIALLFSSGNGWLTLWAKRKALEEQHKIKELTD